MISSLDFLDIPGLVRVYSDMLGKAIESEAIRPPKIVP
jgi:hypothetical protein